MKKITETKTIKIKNANGEILLTTTVGNGNLGGGNVKNDQGQKLCKGMLVNFNLGMASLLLNRKIIVTTNGLDINPQRNDIPVIHKFSGSAIDEVNHEFNEEAEEDGIVAYIIDYTFTN